MATGDYSPLNDLRRGQVNLDSSAREPFTSWINRTQNYVVANFNAGGVVFDEYISAGMYFHTVYGMIVSAYTGSTESDFFIGELEFYLGEKPIVKFPVNYVNSVAAGVIGLPLQFNSVFTGSTTGCRDSLLVTYLPTTAIPPVNCTPFYFTASVDRVRLTTSRAEFPASAPTKIITFALRSTNVLI